MPLRYALLFCLLFITQVWAAGVDYRVQLLTTPPLAALLEPYLSVFRWHNNPYVDADQLERLHLNTPLEIRNLLATLGYFHPEIESRISQSADGYLLVYQIESGEPTLITDVELRLAGPIREEPDFQSRLAELLEVWPLPIGGRFTQAGWDAAKQRGLQALLIDRFPAASILDSIAEVDPQTAQARLVINYASGPRFTLGALQISGLQRYPRVLVERLAGFAEGEAYTQKKLLDFQQALQDTPNFSAVLVDAPLDAGQPERVPVRVELVEAQQQSVTAGVGYGTDTGSRASLGYQHHNVLSRGWIGSADLRLATLEQSLQVGLQLPPDANGFRDSVNLKQGHSDISGVQLRQQSITGQRIRKRGLLETTLALQLSGERADDGLSTRQRDALVFSEAWTRRDLDAPLDPRDGHVLTARIGLALGGVLSDTSFVHLYARAIRFWPVGKASRLIVRGEVGNVISRDRENIPSDWLFRAGGAGSVRGYRYESLGLQQGDAVLPGRVLGTLSVEYQQPVVGLWRAAVFADAGGAADRWQDFHAVKGVGTGARWVSPVGPLAFDLAYGVDKRQWQLHFALGAGF